MEFPDKWLIATNGTKYASEAVRYAGKLSAQLNKKPDVTILVIAIDDDSEDTAKGVMEMANYLFEESGGKDLSPRLMVRIGEPGEKIIEIAKQLKCNHILIGGADFKWDIKSKEPGGISNYIIDKFNGVITVVK